jgi:ferredoxin, 2Fe-2S
MATPGIFWPNLKLMSNTITIHITNHLGLTTIVEAKVGKTLMDVATSKNIDGIAADCGGLMTCATCHVFVDQPFASRLPPPDAEELAMLVFTAVPRQPGSRLSCQITISKDLDGLSIQLPSSQY